MVRLLVVTPKYPPQSGGAAHVFSLIAENLVRNYNSQVYVLTSSCRGCQDHEGLVNGVPVKRLFPYFERRWQKLLFSPITFLLVFLYFLRNHNKFDVVETHTVGEICFFSQIMAKVFKKKLVKYIIDMFAFNSLLKWPKADRYINCGSVITKKMLSFGIPEEKIYEIKVPIVPVRVATKVRRAKGPIKFVFLGELSQIKGVEDLLYAVRNLLDKYDSGDMEMHIAGSGPLRDAVLDASKTDNRIRYHGRMAHEKVIDLLKQTDVLIYPAYSDVMSLTILEAMMTGNMIIASDVGEIKKNVGNAGIIIQPGDKTALKNAMEYVLEKDITKIKANALKQFSKYTAEDVYARNLEAVSF